jgi:hypothetical protein
MSHCTAAWARLFTDQGRAKGASGAISACGALTKPMRSPGIRKALDMELSTITLGRSEPIMVASAGAGAKGR